jgi:hypothetical protein
MKDLQEAISILAQSSAVWQVLTDVDGFPAWNPFLRQVQGAIRPGGRLTISVQPPSTRLMTFQATVLKVESNRDLVWLARLWGIRGLLDVEQHFEVETTSTETVNLSQRVFLSGLMSALPPLSGILSRRLQRGMAAMNQAVKDRAEQAV